MSKAKELKKISSGGALILFGRVIALICQFVTGILVVRIVSQAELGLLSLTLTLIMILVIITNCGMGLGLARTIAKQNMLSSAKKEVGQTIVSAFFISLLLGLICTISLNAGAERLTLFFDKDGLAYVLKVLSMLILPLAFINVFNAVFRGLEHTKPSVIFSNICLNVSKILIVFAVLIFGLKFNGILAANLASAWVTFLLFAIYLLKKLHEQFSFSFSLRSTFDVLQFSFPLLGVQLLSTLISSVTILILGFFQPVEVVGLYSAPLRLVILLSMPLQSIAFLYLPVATRSIKGKEDSDISELYITTTKWISVLTLPLALIMILDSRFVVTTLFGQNYLEAAGVLVFLSVAHSFHSLLGPNGMTLISFGKRKALLFATAIGGISSTLACIFLIPKLGAIGAALSVCIGMILSGIYVSVELNKRFKIHAFESTFFKPVFLIIIVSIIIFQIIQFVGKELVWLHIVGYLILMSFSLFAPFVTRSISQAEYILFQELQENKKFPLFIKKFIKFLLK